PPCRNLAFVFSSTATVRPHGPANPQRTDPTQAHGSQSGRRGCVKLRSRVAEAVPQTVAGQWTWDTGGSGRRAGVDCTPGALSPWSPSRKAKFASVGSASVPKPSVCLFKHCDGSRLWSRKSTAHRPHPGARFAVERQWMWKATEQSCRSCAANRRWPVDMGHWWLRPPCRSRLHTGGSVPVVPLAEGETRIGRFGL